MKFNVKKQTDSPCFPLVGTNHLQQVDAVVPAKEKKIIKSVAVIKPIITEGLLLILSLKDSKIAAASFAHNSDKRY